MPELDFPMVSMKTLTGLALCTTEAEEWGCRTGFPFSSSVELEFLHAFTKTLPFFILGLLTRGSPFPMETALHYVFLIRYR